MVVIVLNIYLVVMIESDILYNLRIIKIETQKRHDILHYSYSVYKE
jgi:hypothetical protein